MSNIAEEWLNSQSGGNRSCFTLPSGVSLWAPKEAKQYRIRIVGYRAGKNNGKYPPKTLCPGREYFVHYGVGPNRDSVLCPVKTYPTSQKVQRCAVCEYVEQEKAKLPRGQNLSKEEYQKLTAGIPFPKHRHLWAVYVEGEESKGLQVWDVSANNFFKALNHKITVQGDPTVKRRMMNFFQPADGRLLVITASKEPMGGGGTYLDFSDIEFKKPSGELPAAVLKAVPCLDDCLTETDQKWVKELLFGGKDDEEETIEDDEETEGGEDIEDDEDEEDETPKAKKTGKKKPPVDEEDEDEEESEDEEDDEDDDETEEPPAFLKKKAMVKFEYQGKKYRGQVVKINRESQLVEVQTPERDRPFVLDWDEKTLKPAASTPPAEAKKPVKKKVVEDDEDDDDDDEPAPKAKKKTKPPVEDDEDEDEEEEVKPAKKGKAKPVDDDDFGFDDDEDSEDDEDDEPAPKKKAKAQVEEDDDDDWGGPPARKKGKK